MANQFIQGLGQLLQDPYLREYAGKVFMNQLPFAKQDQEGEDKAYLAARGAGIGEFMGRPELPQTLQETYEGGNTDIQGLLDQTLQGPNFNQYPDTGFSPQPASPQPQTQQDVLGAVAPEQQFVDAPKPSTLPKVKTFVTTKYPGTRVTPEYYSALESALDPETLKIAMAMSIAETGAGRDASSFKGDGKKKVNNFYGIHKSVNGKPANQYDPDLPTMIEDLKKNFGPGGRYSTINPETLAYYVRGRAYKDLDKAGKASVDAEYSRYLWARRNME